MDKFSLDPKVNSGDLVASTSVDSLVDAEEAGVVRKSLGDTSGLNVGGALFTLVCVLGLSENVMEIGVPVISGLLGVKCIPVISGNKMLTLWSSENVAVGADIVSFGLNMFSLVLTSVISSGYEDSRGVSLVPAGAGEEWVEPAAVDDAKEESIVPAELTSGTPVACT